MSIEASIGTPGRQVQEESDLSAKHLEELEGTTKANVGTLQHNLHSLKESGSCPHLCISKNNLV